MKKILAVLVLVLSVSGAYAQTAEKQGAQQARDGRDRAAHGRDTGNVKEADAGAAEARQGAANSGGNKEAHENAREAAGAAKEAHEKHDPTPQAAHKGGGGRG